MSFKKIRNIYKSPENNQDWFKLLILIFIPIHTDSNDIFSLYKHSVTQKRVAFPKLAIH